MLTIYKASAGSGKTHTLAYDYIRTVLTLKHPDGRYVLNGSGGRRYSHRHRGILAITFTNAATDEMKARITASLDALAHMDDNGRNTAGKPVDYAGDIIALTGCSPAALRAAAAKALAELLTDYSHFNVSTIDSFFQSVLRTFAREIDHQGDYELAIDSSEVIRQSLSLMLDDVNYSDTAGANRISQWVSRFISERLLEGEKFNIFDRGGALLKDLGRSVEKALNEDFYRYSDRVRQYLDDPSAADAFRRRIAAERRRLDTDLRNAGKQFISLISSLKPGEYNSNFRTIALAAEGGVAKSTSAAWFKDAMDSGTTPPASTFLTASATKKLTKANPALYARIIDAGEALAEAHVNHSVLYRLFTGMLHAVSHLEFTGHASKYLERYLRENNMMLIADAGELLNRIIGDAEIPFIYERTGTRLTNLMIDEFQDTSVLQWSNLKPLVDNSVASGNDNLIIGDVKQAIYRFRNSDPTLLGHTVPDIDFPGRHLSRGDVPADNVNHRSAPGIVMFNNTVFHRIGNTLGVPGYDNVRQEIWPEKAAETAYIRVEISKKAINDIYDEIADGMRRQHLAGYPWNEIVVLVRSNADAKAFITYFLSNHPDIRMLSNEALLLANSPAVRLIMSMLTLVERIIATSGTEDKRFATNDDILLVMSTFDYSLGNGADIETALTDALSIIGGDNNALLEAARDVRNCNSSTLVALIENIIARNVPDEMKTSQQTYIAALQDRAIDHVNGPDPSVHAFIEAYQANIQSWAVQAPATEDAVQVMTIHKAKGLGKQCVYMPKARMPLYGTSTPKATWVPLAEMPCFDGAPDVPPVLLLEITSSQMAHVCPRSPIAPFLAKKASENREDTINNAYVAFTRAKRELIVYAEPADDSFANILEQVLAAPADDEPNPLDLDTAKYLRHDSGATVFEYGSFTTAAGEKGVDAHTVTSPPYKAVSNSGARSLTRVDDILADNIDTGDEARDADEPFTTGAMRAAARRGTAMHAILAEMRTAADLPRAAATVAMRLALQPDEAAEMETDLAQAFSTAPDIVGSWFAPDTKTYSERDIFDVDNNEILRPDRAMELADGTQVVVDYKFTTRTLADHRRRVARYARLISQIEGKPVEAYLWYPLMPEIIKV